MSLENNFTFVGVVVDDIKKSITKKGTTRCDFVIEVKSNFITEKKFPIYVICFGDIAEYISIKARRSAKISVFGEIVIMHPSDKKLENGEKICFLAKEVNVLKNGRCKKVSLLDYKNIVNLYYPPDDFEIPYYKPKQRRTKKVYERK